MRKARAIHARLALAGCLALSSTAFGFQPLVTDYTGTQGSGGNQLEFVMARGKNVGSVHAFKFACHYHRYSSLRSIDRVSQEIYSQQTFHI